MIGCRTLFQFTRNEITNQEADVLQSWGNVMTQRDDGHDYRDSKN